MILKNQERESALQVTNQVHIHLPDSAFTNEASNFWFGALIGASLVIIALASMAET